jgi:hypothetical protein
MLILYNLFSMIDTNWQPPTNNHVTCVAVLCYFITVITYHCNLPFVNYHWFFFLYHLYYNFFIHDVWYACIIQYYTICIIQFTSLDIIIFFLIFKARLGVLCNAYFIRASIYNYISFVGRQFVVVLTTNN